MTVIGEIDEGGDSDDSDDDFSDDDFRTLAELDVESSNYIKKEDDSAGNEIKNEEKKL